MALVCGRRQPWRAILLLAVFPVLASCAIATDDPYQNFNRASYDFNDSLDAAIVLPAARGYRRVLPAAMSRGVSNFFDNLFYPNTLLNNLLQGKLTAGLSDLGRLVVNTTIGLGGVFDVATELNLQRHEEDLGQTLAVWGFETGPYIYLPLLGPYTTRYTPDLVVSNLLNPLFYTHASAAVPLGILNFVNKRADLISQTEARDSSALDAYLFTREAFLQQREFLIYDGSPPIENLDDLFEL